MAPGRSHREPPGFLAGPRGLPALSQPPDAGLHGHPQPEPVLAGAAQRPAGRAHDLWPGADDPRPEGRRGHRLPRGGAGVPRREHDRRPREGPGGRDHGLDGPDGAGVKSYNLEPILPFEPNTPIL